MELICLTVKISFISFDPSVEVNNRVLVNLSGKHGHLALDLPLGQQIGPSVGREFCLERLEGPAPLVEIDELSERQPAYDSNNSGVQPKPPADPFARSFESLGPTY